MMKRCALVLLFVLAVPVRSQPPSPTPAKPGQTQHDIRNDKNSTSKSDDGKGQFPTPRSKQEGSGNVGSSDGGKTSDSKPEPPNKNGNWNVAEIFITVFTGFLVVLAGLQFWAMHRQADYMRRGLRIAMRQTGIASRNAKTAMKAAEVAENTLLFTESADVVLENVTLSTPGMPPNATPFFLAESIVALVFRNAGRTRAEEFRATIWLTVPGKEDEWEPTVHVPTVIAPADVSTFRFVVGTCFSPETIKGIDQGKATLGFHGGFKYRDIFGRMQSKECHGTLNRADGTFAVAQRSVKKEGTKNADQAD